jgi:hypothetical protein
MAASRTRGAVVILAGIAFALGSGLAGPSPAFARREPKPGTPPGQQQDEELYGCDRTFGRQPEGHLQKRTEPAGDHDVRPGDTIRVTVTWEPRDWSSGQLHKVLDCVAVDGRLVRSMQGGESPTANNGQFVRVYTVPDAPGGTQICDQAMLSGPSPRADYDHQISNAVCHTVSRGGAGAPPPCQRGCAEQPPCDRCGETSPCDKGCAEKSPCEGGCYEKSPGQSGCDEKSPCEGAGKSPCDRGCAQKSPCDSGCADQSPCDRGCAQNPPCDRGCAGDACDKERSCDRKERWRHDRHDRHDKDCRCDDGHGHLLRRLIEILI